MPAFALHVHSMSTIYFSLPSHLWINNNADPVLGTTARRVAAGRSTWPSHPNPAGPSNTTPSRRCECASWKPCSRWWRIPTWTWEWSSLYETRGPSWHPAWWPSPPSTRRGRPGRRVARCPRTTRRWRGWKATATTSGCLPRWDWADLAGWGTATCWCDTRTSRATPCRRQRRCTGLRAYRLAPKLESGFWRTPRRRGRRAGSTPRRRTLRSRLRNGDSAFPLHWLR